MKNQLKKYKVCVVGAGNWGQNHIKTLDKFDALGGVVEKKSEIINLIRSQYPDCKIHLDLNDALNANYDGFIVATQSSIHYKRLLKPRECIVDFSSGAYF